MKILFVAGVLNTLIFGLLIPIVGHYRKKNLLAVLSFLIAGGLMVTAFAKAEFSSTQPQSTSLLYIADLDTQTAQWASYDKNLTEWTKQKLGDSPEVGNSTNNVADSKYNTRINYTAKAPFLMLDSLNISYTKDTIISGKRVVSLEISSASKINRYEVFSDKEFNFNNITANGVAAPVNTESGFVYENRRGNRLISYYVDDNEALELELTFENNQEPELLIYAASFDLLKRKELEVSRRPLEQIPMPFVLNDATIKKKSIKLKKTQQVEEGIVE